VVATRHGDELRASGEQVDGMVVSTGMVGARIRREETTYRYVVDDRTYERTIQGASELEEGDVVRVYYDADDPADATLAEEDPQPFWAWAVMLSAMCSSLLLVPVGVVRGWGAWRRRRILQRSPWTQAWFQPRPQGRSVVLAPDPRATPGSLPSVSLSQRRWQRLGVRSRAGGAVELRIAQAGSSVVVTGTGRPRSLELASGWPSP
jgi:hypothetical protein